MSREMTTETRIPGAATAWRRVALSDELDIDSAALIEFSARVLAAASRTRRPAGGGRRLSHSSLSCRVQS